MRKLIITMMVIGLSVFAKNFKPDRDRMIVGVSVDASQHDIELFQTHIRANIDPLYTVTNSFVYIKNDNPKKDFYVQNFDPIGRGKDYSADTLKAWMDTQQFDKASDIDVLKKFDDKWSPKQ